MRKSIVLQISIAALGSLVFASSSFAGPAVLNLAHPAVRAVAAVQQEVTADWMQQPEVIGTAVSLDATGRPVLAVYVDQDSARVARIVRNLPDQVRGVPVEVRLSEKFRAMHLPHHGRHGRQPPPPPIQQTVQQFPIQLGTSGGWGKDTAGNACCSGTLGSLVQIGSQQYILSNWHVLEADIVPGRNKTVATTGDPVIQPGLTDVNCNALDASVVATLEKRDALPNNNVDCAVARVVPGAVRTDGAILEIGTLSSQTLPAAIGQAVKKGGRTTGVTHSTITGLNATVSVEYDQECGGKKAFTKTFTGQIMVGGGSTFLGDGDSGSLLVEDVATNPRAVGLLYAGGNRDSIANPIDEVLSFLGASMVGN